VRADPPEVLRSHFGHLGSVPSVPRGRVNSAFRSNGERFVALSLLGQDFYRSSNNPRGANSHGTEILQSFCPLTTAADLGLRVFLGRLKPLAVVVVLDVSTTTAMATVRVAIFVEEMNRLRVAVLKNHHSSF
jgi:hypothetical protein